VTLLAIKAPERAWWGAAGGVIGSLIGNLILFSVARQGGRRFLEKAEVTGRSQRFLAWFNRYGLVTVFIPCLVPIPLPLKIFVISAGALGIPVRTFLLVVLAARIPRYIGEAWLGRKLGLESTKFLADHMWHLLGFALVLALFLYALIRLNDHYRRGRTPA
jgi:uncharacterized membrane protein YdjX (TVP38/TMEM64 family)